MYEVFNYFFWNLDYVKSNLNSQLKGTSYSHLVAEILTAKFSSLLQRI